MQDADAMHRYPDHTSRGGICRFPYPLIKERQFTNRPYRTMNTGCTWWP